MPHYQEPSSRNLDEESWTFPQKIIYRWKLNQSETKLSFYVFLSAVLHHIWRKIFGRTLHTWTVWSTCECLQYEHSKWLFLNTSFHSTNSWILSCWNVSFYGHSNHISERTFLDILDTDMAFHQNVFFYVLSNRPLQQTFVHILDMKMAFHPNVFSDDTPCSTSYL